MSSPYISPSTFIDGVLGREVDFVTSAGLVRIRPLSILEAVEINTAAGGNNARRICATVATAMVEPQIELAELLDSRASMLSLCIEVANEIARLSGSPDLASDQATGEELEKKVGSGS